MDRVSSGGQQLRQIWPTAAEPVLSVTTVRSARNSSGGNQRCPTTASAALQSKNNSHVPYSADIPGSPNVSMRGSWTSFEIALKLSALASPINWNKAISLQHRMIHIQ
eukprot:GHUV01055978.1.p1 GENE.GHUV01055978.1~~GHUV01055978.1.p1  ORF type:complete len:108 (+),score=24.72 GHUV01055978.1:183-506(+)